MATRPKTQPEDQPGRYQVVAGEGETHGFAILLDTATGRSWFATSAPGRKRKWTAMSDGPDTPAD